jgi:hypothetical protein
MRWCELPFLDFEDRMRYGVVRLCLSAALMLSVHPHFVLGNPPEYDAPQWADAFRDLGNIYESARPIAPGVPGPFRIYDQPELMPPSSAYQELTLTTSGSEPSIYDMKNGLPVPKSGSPGDVFNTTESALLGRGVNVLRLRQLDPVGANKMVSDFWTALNGQDRSKSTRSNPAMLKSFLFDKGMYAIPDEGVWKAFQFLKFDSGRGANRKQFQPFCDVGEVRTMMVENLDLVAQFLQTNDELKLNRAQVLDETLKDKNDPRSSRRLVIEDTYQVLTEFLSSNQIYDPNQVNPESDKCGKALAKLGETFGFQRTPTIDEAMGMCFWQQYFTGREAPGGAGEYDVGNLLMTPEIRLASDAMRTMGRNRTPAQLEPQMRTNVSDANFRKLPQGDPNRIGFWRTAELTAIPEIRGTELDPVKRGDPAKPGPDGR